MAELEEVLETSPICHFTVEKTVAQREGVTPGSRFFSRLKQGWAESRAPFWPLQWLLSYMWHLHMKLGARPERRTEGGVEGRCHTGTGRCCEDAVKRGAGRTWQVQVPRVTTKQKSALLFICFAALANSLSESQFWISIFESRISSLQGIVDKIKK